MVTKLHSLSKIKKYLCMFLLLPALSLSASASAFAESEATRRLKEHGNDLTPRIIKISDNVYTAVNYNAATMSMIIGENGVVFIDAGQFYPETRKALDDLKKYSDKPVLGIVYTHAHGDHASLAMALLEDNPEGIDVEIWARDNFGAESNAFVDLNTIFKKRGLRQTGMALPREKRINNGVAPVLYPPKKGEHVTKNNIPVKPILPNKTFGGEVQKIKIDTIELELYKAPGETDDQLFVWYPKEEILFTGDNAYGSFPNLYAVRGAGYRDVRVWIESLTHMLEFPAKALVFGHNLPVVGAEESKTYLTNFRDAVKYVYDKSIEGMNKGLTIDELAEYVNLPPHLAELDYLTEYYGNVDWSVKNIFVGHLGWFDGNARKLMPLTIREEAEHMAQLAGGNEQLLEKAKQALKDNDPKWAAQLADYCMALDMPAEIIMADALDVLAEQQITATGRNYMFTYAQELRAKHNNK